LRVEAEGKMSKFKIQLTNDIRELVGWFHWFNWLKKEKRALSTKHETRTRNIMSNVNGRLPISLERTLKNFCQPFLVLRFANTRTYFLEQELSKCSLSTKS